MYDDVQCIIMAKGERLVQTWVTDRAHKLLEAAAQRDDRSIASQLRKLVYQALGLNQEGK